MGKKLTLIMLLLISVTASPVFAGLDYGNGSQLPMNFGSQKSREQEAAQGSKDTQNAKDSEILLKSCDQHIERIYQRIQRLQMEIRDKRVSTSVLDELKKLEQALKEANNIARSLRVM